MKILTVKYLLSFFTGMILMFDATPDHSVPKIYPVPPVNENSLFYIQRTKNTNAIVYELNRTKDGKVNAEDPVKIFWISYSTDSTVSELTAIQRKYAYGINSRPYNAVKDSYVLQFVAYKKRNIYLLPSGKDKYAAFTNINGKLSELKKIFISTKGGTFWFPVIEYVELSGKDPSNKQTVIERFVP